MWIFFLTSIFLPSSELYHSKLDGSWEFGEIVVSELTVRKHSSILFSLLDEEISLNNSAEPQYLVQNKFVKTFTLKNKQDLWLELVYQPWSQETEAGFDQPVMVVYINDELVLKKGITEVCCQQQTEQIYLGRLQGKQTLSIFAGETGDLLKPSGIIFQTVNILGQKLVVVKPITSEQETIITGNSNKSPLAVQSNPEEETIITKLPNDGQVLGVEENQATRSIANQWQLKLKNLIEKPWFIGLIWLVVTIVIFFLVNAKNTFVTPNVRLVFKNVFSRKKKKGKR